MKDLSHAENSAYWRNLNYEETLTYKPRPLFRIKYPRPEHNKGDIVNGSIVQAVRHLGGKWEYKINNEWVIL